MTLSELHESQPKPLPDHLRALANYCQWCARNVESLGDTSRWFLELETELRRIIALPTGWQPIETAPQTDELVLLWAAARDDLRGFVTIGAYHPDAGWCVDELREVTHWQPLPAPPETTS